MPKPSTPWMMLVARSAMFLAFQLLIAVGFAAAGNSNPLYASARWWPLIAITTNLICIALLVRLFRAEGKRYLDLLRFSRATWKMDLLWLVGLSVIGMPLAAAPMMVLPAALFGDTLTAPRMMFQALPAWAMILTILFPLTIGLSELPTYFGYVMPRLGAQLKSGWIAWALASFFLAFQHIFLPYLPDPRFWAYRGLMYLPFALFAGLLIKLRPQLLPYFVVIHVLLDFSALSVYFML